ncbi:hypothetical protein AC579_10422 [Pseudocercospora musae]|uniref:Pectate lyase domain-containing protein n=1 Tax=Pseudocercospora musae TaxID=113226 RepID=A0A139IMD5_9PEZI|nr:hypothetical protein AC579_10422 [Pseudocercospora musae]
MRVTKTGYYEWLLWKTHNYVHDHWKSSLVGNCDVLRDVDLGHLHITYHHNHRRNCGTRGPAGRFGHELHLQQLVRRFFFWYQATHSRSDNQVLVEANNFIGKTRIALDTQKRNDFGDAIVNITQEEGDFYKADYKYELTPLKLVESTVRQSAGFGKIKV